MSNNDDLTNLLLAEKYMTGSFGFPKDLAEAESLCNYVIRTNRSKKTALIAYRYLTYIYRDKDYKNDKEFADKCDKTSLDIERKLHL